MRILLTIPHYFSRQPGPERHGSSVDGVAFRAAALDQCVHAIHQSFAKAQSVMQIRERRTDSANSALSALVHVVVCTVGNDHLLEECSVSRELYQQHRVQCDPKMLGFECRNVLRDRWGNYDWYGYLEDDLILHDPWFFAKLKVFTASSGSDAVLLPNRFERGTTALTGKAYVDGDIAEKLTSDYQDISHVPVIRGTALGVPVEFRRPLNPHSGCYFLSSEQMSNWMAGPHFTDRSTSFIGPLESAATLALMKAFRVYKPANSVASFLEIEHAGQRFICQLRRPEPEGGT